MLSDIWKSYDPPINSFKQYSAFSIVHCLLTILNNIVEPDLVWEYCSILLTTMNNMGTKILFLPACFQHQYNNCFILQCGVMHTTISVISPHAKRKTSCSTMQKGFGCQKPFKLQSNSRFNCTCFFVRYACLHVRTASQIGIWSKYKRPFKQFACISKHVNWIFHQGHIWCKNE